MSCWRSRNASTSSNSPKPPRHVRRAHSTSYSSRAPSARRSRPTRSSGAATTPLVTIGACATAGGIQALRNWADHDAVRSLVYPDPGYVESLATSTPIADHVTVDAELRGCPIAPDQLREFVTAVLVGRR